jgi:MFS family permease
VSVREALLPRHPAVLLLGASQVVGYGTFYYSFGVLAAGMAAEFGWPVSWVFAAFSVALLAGGLIAPMAGRQIDRRGAAAAMTWGTAGASLSLLAMAAAPNPAVFVIGLIGTQIAGAYALYDAAFACLVQFGPRQARARITHLTLIAGFASTIFWPLTSALHDLFSWREVLAGFAALNLLVCLPAHLLLGRLSRAQARVSGEDGARAVTEAIEPSLAGSAARAGFALVAAGFALCGLVLSAVLAQMVPIIENLGVRDHAVLCAALFGPSQVAIRLFSALAVGRSALALTLLSAAFLTAAMLLPLATGASALGAAMFAMLFGFASGLHSIVRGTLPLHLFGSLGYATRMGQMATVRLVLTAFAPFAFAEIEARTGAAAALAVMAAAGIAALGCFVALGRLVARSARAG